MDHEQIKAACPHGEHEKSRLQVNDEHGQTWVTCLDCGAQWSVHESNIGLVFEEVSVGDNWCSENNIPF